MTDEDKAQRAALNKRVFDGEELVDNGKNFMTISKLRIERFQFTR